jgi:hypothetical protein
LKAFIFSFYIFIFCSACKNDEQSLPILNLTNEGILKVTDSIKLNLDSLAMPVSECTYLIDSLLYICNTEVNLISKININSNKITHTILNFSRFGKPQKFSAISVQKETFLGIQNNTKKGFIFNSRGGILDSFLLANTKDNLPSKIITDNPLISTIQPLLVKDSLVYSLGFALLEGNHFRNDLRFVLCGSTKKEKEFYVNYPKFYNDKNWGGTYLRMVYGTIVDDSIMVISFPVTSDLAVFNSKSKSIRNVNCYPNIENVVSPVANLNETKIKQIDVAKHFFKQYSFQALIFDKYRNVYYRILNKPMPIKNNDKNSIGNLNKLILVYDNKFSYLGYKEIQGSLYSNTTLLIHPKGLLIQKLKNSKDEEHIYFDLFSLDSTVISSLSKK